MFMIGALLANADILSLEVLETALEDHLPERHMKYLPANKAALREGATYTVGEGVLS
jgi:Pyruvate/2-oxoacid:ferredoxin oxidoreductase gamma subunit